MSDLLVEVQDGEIFVTLPYTHYTVTYYKPANSPQLLAKRFPGKDDPHARLTHAEVPCSRLEARQRQGARVGVDRVEDAAPLQFARCKNQRQGLSACPHHA